MIAGGEGNVTHKCWTRACQTSPANSWRPPASADTTQLLRSSHIAGTFADPAAAAAAAVGASTPNRYSGGPFASSVASPTSPPLPSPNANAWTSTSHNNRKDKKKLRGNFFKNWKLAAKQKWSDDNELSRDSTGSLHNHFIIYQAENIPRFRFEY